MLSINFMRVASLEVWVQYSFEYVKELNLNIPNHSLCALSHTQLLRDIICLKLVPLKQNCYNEGVDDVLVFWLGWKETRNVLHFYLWD